jgi:hypothetical protein
MKRCVCISVFTGLCLASWTGLATEAVYTEPVVNRWSVVRCEARLPAVFRAAMEFSHWLLLAKNPLPPLEWRAASRPSRRLARPKTRTRDYPALSDSRVPVERPPRSDSGKRDRLDHSLSKVKWVRARPVAW